MGACDAPTILVSVTHGGVALGIPISFNYEWVQEDVVVRDAGGISPACRSVIGQDFTCVVDYLVPPLSPLGLTPASLVISMLDGGGGSVVDTITNMIARGSSQEINRDSPPMIYRQRFVIKNSMTASPVTVVES